MTAIISLVGLSGASSYGRAAFAVNAKAFGAAGDGVQDDTAALQAALDYCFGPGSSPHGAANSVANTMLRIPPGLYKITSPLLITQAVGARIIGSGRFTTKIQNITAGSTVISTNGCAYSRFESLWLGANGAGSCCFDLNWDGTSGGVALQSNTFADMLFDGADLGVQVGRGGTMGSENLFVNCFFARNAVAGFKTCNFNALQNRVLGGNMQSCGIGVWVSSGSVPLVDGVGFQGQTSYDIQVDNSANDTILMMSCRSESLNHARLGNRVHAKFESCSHLNAANGVFVAANNCPTVIDNCVSIGGQIPACSERMSIRNSSFGRTDWLVLPIAPGVIEVENVQYGGTPNGSGAGNPVVINRQRATPAGFLSYTPS